MIGAFCFALLAVVTVRIAIAAFGKDGSAISKAAAIQDQPALDWATGSDSLKAKYAGTAIVWRDYRVAADNPDIYAQFVDLKGIRWWPSKANPAENGIAMCKAAGVQRNPRAAVGGKERSNPVAWFGWIDERDNNSPRIYVNARKLASVNANARVQDGVRVCTDDHEQRTFDMAGDDWSSSDVIVVWADNRNQGKDFDIYAQRLAITQQGIERKWGDEGKVVCSEDGKQARPRVVLVDPGHGLFVVVWEDARNGANDRDIYAQELDTNGNRNWALAGMVVCNDARHQQNFDVDASRGGQLTGYTLIAWQDHRNATPDTLDIDIYAQQLDAKGEPVWPLEPQPLGDGIPVCTAVGAQLRPRICTDMGFGAYVAWLDKRNADPKIYRQHIRSKGAPQWTAQGLEGLVPPADQSRAGYSVSPVCGLKLNKQYGADLALVSTEPTADAGVNIVAEYIDKVDGKVAQKQTICGAKLDQYQLVATTVDFSDEIIAAWKDERQSADEADVYASFATFRTSKEPVPEIAKAPVAGGVPALPGQLTLLPGRPNPFTSSTELEIGLPRASDVRVDVFDVAGRRVAERRLTVLPGGWQRVTFDGRDDRGRPLSSGVYFCRVTAGNQVANQKMVIER
jgi:hypothetical protein